MKCIDFKKVHQGKYLKNYEITYLNRAGKHKTYEMVSFNEMNDLSQLGQKTNGISIAAVVGDRLLLLREFRMAVAQSIYNLCAGMIEADEAIEDAIRRELYEETGLSVKRIIKILPPSFAAVGISDTQTSLCFVEAEGEIDFHGSANEEISAVLYTKNEVEKLLNTERFSSRSQLVAYSFVNGLFNNRSF